jgi:amino acid transporter
VPVEEATNPRRHLPRALLATIAATTVLYVLIQIVAERTLPGLASSPTPLAAAAREFMGPGGAAFITVAAALSTLGSASALVLVAPRILYAFAQHGQLPPALARVHPRFLTPYRSVAVVGVVIWTAALSGGFETLAAVSAVARLVFCASTCVAVLVLRRTVPSEEGFRLPGGPLIPVLAVALSLWLLAGITAAQAVAGLLALAAGALCFALARAGRR